MTETPVEEAVIKKAIDETGYTYKGMKTEPYEKERLLLPPFWLSHEWFCFLGRHHPLYGNKPRRLLRFFPEKRTQRKSKPGAHGICGRGHDGGFFLEPSRTGLWNFHKPSAAGPFCQASLAFGLGSSFFLS